MARSSSVQATVKTDAYHDIDTLRSDMPVQPIRPVLALKRQQDFSNILGSTSGQATIYISIEHSLGRCEVGLT